MEASSRSLKQLFAHDRRFIAPLFQRPYVWTRALQWAPLWEDVCAASDRRLHSQPHQTHFLGAIVLDQLRVAVGELDARLVVDGQQRLATLQLLMAALRDLCRSLGHPRYEHVFNRLTINEDPMIREQEEIYKVWPTYTDRPHFMRTMNAGSPAVIRELYQVPEDQDETGYLIPDAYLYFWSAAQAWLDAPDQDGRSDLERRLEQLATALAQDLILVVIDLDAHDNAQLIFETLNARGAPLLPADLVKNMLFDLAGSQREPVERLYKEYWQGFDQDSRFWREEVRHGRDQMARLDAFLHYYLALHEPEDPYGRGLYAAFRDHVRRADTKRYRASSHLSSLWSYGELYRRLHGFDPNTREGLFIYRLDLLDGASMLPLLMELLKNSTMAHFRRSIVWIESYLARRMLCQLSSRDHGRVAVQMVEAMRAAKDFSPARVYLLLDALTTDAAVWPDDEQLARVWLHAPYYKLLLRKRLRMVLEALDLAMTDGHTERVHLGDSLSIEHLMPNAWQASWPLPECDDVEAAVARREALLDTIGNLTLMTQKLNSKLANGPWINKKRHMMRHSALSINRALLDEERWDEESIERRTLELLQSACAIWPRLES